MKSSIFLVFLVCAHVLVMSQTATQTRLEYQKGEKAAATIELPYSVEIVEGAIRKRLESATVKEERLKGMQVFKGGRTTPTDGEAVDFYFKVDRKGRKEDSTSVVYLILGRPNENVALRNLNDDFRVQDAKSFLNALVPVVEKHKLDTDIAHHEDLVKKSERTLNNLQNDQRDYEKRIRELQEKLAQNRRDQETQSAELAKQRSARDALISKKASAGR